MLRIQYGLWCSLLAIARAQQQLFVTSDHVDSACALKLTDLPTRPTISLYRVVEGSACPRELVLLDSSLSHDQHMYWLSPSTVEQPNQKRAQIAFMSSTQFDALYASDQGQLVPLTDTEAHIMTSDPDYAHFELLAIPFEPAKPVDPSSVDRLAHETKRVVFRPLIDMILSSLPKKDIVRDVRTLSGEDQSALPKSARWRTRHSMSAGVWNAKDWIKSQFENEAGLACKEHPFRNGFVPMIACHIQGRSLSNETVVIGAHYDSRGTFGNVTAGGADDDGSGTALILSVAKQIHRHRLRFERNVIIAAFAGEEQGLVGSDWFAKHLRDQGTDVVMMLQLDMIGYRKAQEPMQMAFPDLIGLAEARYFVSNISTIYAPEVVVGFTPACCSDHQSFVNQGFPATWVFERNGPIYDPCYHNSCDLSDRQGYDFEQIYQITRVVLASVLQLAKFSFP